MPAGLVTWIQREVAARTWAHALALIVAAAFFLWHGGLTPVPVEANKARFNPAQLYLFGFLVAMFWLPVAGWQCGRMIDWWRRAAKRPSIGSLALVLIVLVGLTLLLNLTFVNPHPWNHRTDEGTIEFLRNFVLVCMDESSALRMVIIATSLLGLAGLGIYVLGSPQRRPIFLLAGISVLFLLPHALVDPRYYIIPFVLLSLLLPLPDRLARVQTAWLALGSVAVCWYQVACGFPI